MLSEGNVVAVLSTAVDVLSGVAVIVVVGDGVIVGVTVAENGIEMNSVLLTGGTCDGGLSTINMTESAPLTLPA